uniref:Glutamine synthetase n=1 Tax=Coccolithus braarudii TaxID=221442 RepID=A0A7S0LRH0_9EUKA
MIAILPLVPGLVLPQLTALRAPRAAVRMAESIELDSKVLDRYLALPVAGQVQAEYLWIDAIGEVRSKCRTVPAAKATLDQLPDWNYDGSSTGQAPGDDSEVIIKPRAIFKDPFRPGDNILVLTDTYTPGGTPLPTNTRAPAMERFEKTPGTDPWFGLEQEYTLFNMDKVTPLGWPIGGYPGPQGPYYCSAGADRAYGRAISEAHYKACLYAGLAISGTNAEVMPGQWEYQIGPATGIAAGDEMMVSRYILQRVCEDFGVYCTLDPKPIPGDWNGAGCHTNFSTEKMRKAGGLKDIEQAIRKLGAKHAEHIAAYGEGNERRLTGACETASINDFSYGVANRGCSIRIPRATNAEGCGYLEDRRPSSNCDPYVVTSLVFETSTNPDGEEADIKPSSVSVVA